MVLVFIFVLYINFLLKIHTFAKECLANVKCDYKIIHILCNTKFKLFTQ